MKISEILHCCINIKPIIIFGVIFKKNLQNISQSILLTYNKNVGDRMSDILLCSNCFKNRGLSLDATKIGTEDSTTKCPNCSTHDGAKLDSKSLFNLLDRFFVRGTVHTDQFCASPAVVFNKHQKTCIRISKWLDEDVRLLEDKLGVGFFYYGPPLWMLGHTEPLKKIQTTLGFSDIVSEIVSKYPEVYLSSKDTFYRLRINPTKPSDIAEYDSPPVKFLGNGRLDSKELPIFYGSQNIEVCIHECKASIEDEIYMATFNPTKNLKLLDLTELIDEDGSEFESIDLAVIMLFFSWETLI